MGHMSPAENISKQQEFVLRTIEERDIRFIRLWFTDILGTLKSVAIAPAELDSTFEEGIGFDGSAIQGFAREFESDMLAKPDPAAFTILPWRAEAQGAAIQIAARAEMEAARLRGQGVAAFRQEVAAGLSDAALRMESSHLDPSYLLFSMWTETLRHVASEGQGNLITFDGSLESMQRTMLQFAALNQDGITKAREQEDWSEVADDFAPPTPGTEIKN